MNSPVFDTICQECGLFDSFIANLLLYYLLPFKSASTLKQKPKLLTHLSEVIRLKHYSLKTEKSYIHWCRRFILFHKKRHPQDMGTQEVQAFLNYLAVDQRVSASTQNQALNAIVFLYKHVIKKELGAIDAIRARRPKRLPVVLTREETRKILSLLSGDKHLMGSILYGSGLRLMECLCLRIKDIDYSADSRTVQELPGRKVSFLHLPASNFSVHTIHVWHNRKGYRYIIDKHFKTPQMILLICSTVKFWETELLIINLHFAS